MIGGCIWCCIFSVIVIYSNFGLYSAHVSVKNFITEIDVRRLVAVVFITSTHYISYIYVAFASRHGGTSFGGFP